MTISLSQMIADLNAKIATADSNTPIATILEYVTEAEKLGGGKIIYDSASVLPSDSAYEGMIAYVADSATLKVRGDYGWVGVADSASVEPYIFQGSVSGYNSGGGISPGYSNVIDKFPFATDANATDVGDMTIVREMSAGQSSTVSGYTSGGRGPDTNVIDKFPFAVDANATDVGDLTLSRRGVSGQSSTTNGYTSGGDKTFTPGPESNVIDKFPFSVDANATDVGDLTNTIYGSSGASSSDNGYSAGGLIPPYTNIIDKFPFSSDENATDVGDLTLGRSYPAGISGATHGYAANGTRSPIASNIIDKYSFSSDGNATDVGDATVSDYGRAGNSSTTHGYIFGGSTNVIEKFPFATDENAIDVGDLTLARYYSASQQV